MMEKCKKNFLILVSAIVALAYAICFYNNSTGIACTVFGIFITSVLARVIVHKKKRKLKHWDYIWYTADSVKCYSGIYR